MHIIDAKMSQALREAAHTNKLDIHRVDTVNGILDARDSMVTRDVQNYFLEECSHQDSLFEWRRVTSSPEAYTRYACHRFVDALYPETRIR